MLKKIEERQSRSDTDGWGWVSNRGKCSQWRRVKWTGQVGSVELEAFGVEHKRHPGRGSSYPSAK